MGPGGTVDEIRGTVHFTTIPTRAMKIVHSPRPSLSAPRPAPVFAATLVCLIAAAQAVASAPLHLEAERKGDRVVVTVDGVPFTEYEFGEEWKYPHFYPVNGPATGQSVTVRRTDPFPHHTSLFFSCDRVNGGNYWQQGLERGRIASEDIRLVRSSGDEVVFEQDARWVRPDAPSPFADHRVITVRAPSENLRVIDYAITLRALIDVTIERTNHSLFSARMAPDLAVDGGGSLINDRGQSGEDETFGKNARWMDTRGPRGEAVEGLAILPHPQNDWMPTPWFTRNYGFFSPTPTFWWTEPFQMKTGETLTFRYRVVVHSGDPAPAEIDRMLENWEAEHGK